MIGTRISFFDQIDSTNDYMKNHLDEFHDGDILIAQTQTSGRGRRDRQWISPRGNLYASFCLSEGHFKSAFDVIMLFSNALIDVLETLNIKATIKYPNDILVNGIKISGILIEHKHNSYIIGVGLNVLPIDSYHPRFQSTSLSQELHIEMDYRDILQMVIRALNKRLQDKTNWYEDYRKYSFVLQKYIEHKSSKCLIKDITIDGELILDDGKQQRKIRMNEISLEELYDN